MSRFSDAWSEEAREAALAARQANKKGSAQKAGKGIFQHGKPTKEQRSVFKKSFLKHLKALHGKSGGGKGLSPVGKMLGYGTSAYSEGLFSRADRQSRFEDITSRVRILNDV